MTVHVHEEDWGQIQLCVPTFYQNPEGRGRVLIQYIDYMGLCCCTGYGFKPFYQDQGIENTHFRSGTGCQI